MKTMRLLIEIDNGKVWNLKKVDDDTVGEAIIINNDKHTIRRIQAVNVSQMALDEWHFLAEQVELGQTKSANNLQYGSKKRGEKK